MTDVARVPPHLALDVLAQVETQARRGMERSSLSYEELRAACVRGAMDLWAVHDEGEVIAVIVLQVTKRTSGLVLGVVLAAGRDMSLWLEDVERLIAEYAELLGAVLVVSTARPGLARLLKRFGWKPRAIVMEKTIGQ